MQMADLKRGIIAVGREYGSGGRFIARRAAELLGVPFYDRELITMAAERTGLSPEFIKNAEENRSSAFMYGPYFTGTELPPQDQVFIAQSKIIKKLASEGPCVIVGRCADYVLRGRDALLSVFIHAPAEQKIARAREFYGLQGDDREVLSIITKYDKKRAAYYNEFTMSRWGDARSYDVTISSALGIDDAAHALTELAKGSADR